MTTLTDIENYLIERANTKTVLDTKLKFVFPEGVVVVDGTSGHYNIHQTDVSNENCAIYIDTNTFDKIRNKQLNPIMAYTFRKLKVKGDIDVALKVIGFL